MTNRIPPDGGNEDESLGELDELIKSIKSRLHPGGPELDYKALFAYLDDDLTPEDKNEVEKRIVTWEEWHAAYWELLADFAVYEQYERATESIVARMRRLLNEEDKNN